MEKKLDKVFLSILSRQSSVDKQGEAVDNVVEIVHKWG
jgi:hypothetical protein